MRKPGESRPMCDREPKGITDCPAYGRYRIEDIPATREDNRLATLVDWRWVRRCIRDGYAVGIVVGPDDSGLLIDAIQQYVGFGLVIRHTEPGVVWFHRPEALFEAEEQECRD